MKQYTSRLFTTLITLVSISTFAASSSPAALVAAYNFDEASGTILNDYSGNANNGTISGATWATGHDGGALSFDGADDWVTIADSASLDLTTGMTLEAWVNPTVQSSLATYVIPDIPTPGAEHDDNIWWDGLGHNSQDGLYRVPFGAINPGDELTLRFRSYHNDLTRVRVRFWDTATGSEFTL